MAGTGEFLKAIPFVGGDIGPLIKYRKHSAV
jgi:hypothetical protein